MGYDRTYIGWPIAPPRRRNLPPTRFMPRFFAFLTALLVLATTPFAHGAGVLDTLAAKVGIGNPPSGQMEFLDVDQAFRLSLRDATATQITAHWKIAAGYYLYQDKFKFTVKNPAGIRAETYAPPPSETKADPSFGTVQVYHDAVALAVPLTRGTHLQATDMLLEIKYQGCADAGFCYPPQTKTLTVKLPALNTAAATNISLPPDGGTLANNAQGRLAAALAQGNMLHILGIYFLAGVLLAFTPCMFPMIPILSSLIVGQGKDLKPRRAFTLSLMYVLGMAFTYTLVGILAGLSGANLQAAFQNPWIIGSFAAIFIALALSMFGLYDLQIPAAWQAKLVTLSNRQRGGSHTGVGIMGILSALIVGPCLAAPLAAALIYIGQTGDATLGGSALFALSMGMGVPLLIIGSSAGHWLPRAGSWMVHVKHIFGVILIGLAIWMLERVVPPAVTLALWAALLVVSAVYLGALDRLEPEAGGWRKLWKGAGVVMLLYGSFLLLGAVAGGHDPLQPLRNTALLTAGSSSASPTAPPAFRNVKGLAGLEQAVSTAQQQGKAVFVDFYADWCISCKELERTTFADPAVRQVLDNLVLLRVDVTANDADDQALMRHYGVIGPPSMLFFGPDGNERRSYRLVGFVNAANFLDHIQAALGDTA